MCFGPKTIGGEDVTRLRELFSNDVYLKNYFRVNE